MISVCPRCPKEIRDVRDLERHFVEDHLMGILQAKAAAQLIVKDAGATPAIPALEIHAAEHICPGCKTVIACDWEAIAQLDKHARDLREIATKWRLRKQGMPTGGARRKNQEWTDEQARDLVVMGGMSLRAVGRLFGAHVDTIKLAVKNGAKR